MYEYINVRQVLVPTVMLHCILYNPYLRYCVQTEDGYTLQKHLAGLHMNKVVFGL
jgi:hypothetical protein